MQSIIIKYFTANVYDFAMSLAAHQHHSFFHNCNLQFIGLVQPGTRHLFYCWCQRNIVSCSKTLHHECVSKHKPSFIAESKLLNFQPCSHSVEALWLVFCSFCFSPHALPCTYPHVAFSQV